MSQEQKSAGTQVSGAVVAVLWTLTVLLAWLGVGRYLDETVTGIAPGERAPAIVAVVPLLAALAATFLWARALGRDRTPPSTGRRRFLTGAATATGGLIASVAGTAIALRGWLTN